MKIPHNIRLAVHILALVTIFIATESLRSENSLPEQSAPTPKNSAQTPKVSAPTTEAKSTESPTVELTIQEKLLKEHQRLNQP